MNQYKITYYYNTHRLEKIVKAKNQEAAERKILNRYSICRIVSIVEV